MPPLVDGPPEVDGSPPLVPLEPGGVAVPSPELLHAAVTDIATVAMASDATRAAAEERAILERYRAVRWQSNVTSRPNIERKNFRGQPFRDFSAPFAKTSAMSRLPPT
jgi:hypothetical protein